MRPDLLHVIGVYSNPMRFNSHQKRFIPFEQRMIDQGVKYYTVECEFRDRPFVLEPREGVTRIQVRSRDVLWNKENLCNIGAMRLPKEAEYLAFVDGDVAFMNPNWASDTVHALQLRPIVQMYTEALFLGPDNQYLAHGKSIMALRRDAQWKDHAIINGTGHYMQFMKKHPYGFPGLCWAYRREAYRQLDGMLDTCIVGAGDHHMAQALLQVRDSYVDFATPAYARAIEVWRKRADRFIDSDVGVVNGLAAHFWHGPRVDRKYGSRWSVLTRNSYDPTTDIWHDGQGLVQLTRNKPQLRDDLHAYFEGRNEDSIHLG